MDTSKSVDYPLNGYPCEYRENTYIIFIKRDGHEYYPICVLGYQFTYLTLTLFIEGLI